MTVDMKKEVRDLMRMAVNWRRGYESWLTGDGDDYVFEEYLNEMTTHLLPYINRLRQTGYMSEKDVSAMTFFYLEQVQLLKERSQKIKEEKDGASRTA